MTSPSGPKLEPAPFNVAPPGTLMSWTRLDAKATGQGRIGRAEGKLLHYTWEGKPQRMYLFCIRCAGSDVSFDEGAYDALFPLETGKSVAFERRVGEWHWTNRIHVIDTECLKLAFGEVNTYVVLSDTHGLNNPFNARSTMWYAPSIGWNVKFEYSDSRGDAYSWQAVEFRRPH